MIRTVLYLLLAVILITLLRVFLGAALKAFSGLLQPGGVSRPGSARRAGSPTAGELKRDPVCGTFVAAESSVKKTVDGEVIHFCSAACRDKYAG
jgi:YHS domain-containing protein